MQPSRWSRPPTRAGSRRVRCASCMSVRQIGEGHRSSIGFRTGWSSTGGEVTIDPPGPYTTPARSATSPSMPRSFARPPHRRRRRGDRGWVLDGLAPTLHRRPADGPPARARGPAGHPSQRRRDRRATASSWPPARYNARFPGTSELSERVLYPADRRRVPRHRGRPIRALRRRRWHGHVLRHVHRLRRLQSPNSCWRPPTSRRSRRLRCSAPAAANKGLALFPRRIDGRFHALSRCDGERNAIAVSDDIRHWPTVDPARCPRPSLGARSSSATAAHRSRLDDGWLVLTHGVGADADVLDRSAAARPRRPDASSSAVRPRR